MKSAPESFQYVQEKTSLPVKSIENVLKLHLEEKCTIPFITRYRKEMTQGLDEVEIRKIIDSHQEYEEREKRREFILDAIKKLEKLTPALEKKILSAPTLKELEDLYAPFKSKRKTKGQMAIEAGLAPLAKFIKESQIGLDDLRKEWEGKVINKEKGIESWEDALTGAQNILVEEIAQDVPLKDELRKQFWKHAVLVSEIKSGMENDPEAQKFRDYFNYSEKVDFVKEPKALHRFLAMRRGQNLKILKLNVEFPEEEALNLISAYVPTKSGDLGTWYHEVMKRAFKLYLLSSLDLEIKSDLKKLADETAIGVFATNLKDLLLSPYLGPKKVLAIDPGVRTGCKVVVIEDTGKFVFDTVIYPHPPQNKVMDSKAIIEHLIQKFEIEYIAIGDGTFGRETLHFLEDHLKDVSTGQVKCTLISESGASIYSTSEMGRKEFPDLDSTVRGAISIGRRFQDPLAELVKIDPKSIGVGQYQHDVNQSKLKKSLTGVVEDCVNFVGVDVNTSSAPLLSYISGIGPTLAKNLVDFRDKKKGIKSRKELLEVPRFSQKVFEQCAGFLRIYGGECPLDSTFIHPESYDSLESWAEGKGLTLKELVENLEVQTKLEEDGDLKQGMGEYTFKDIVTSLKAPRQDPRKEFKSTAFEKNIRSIEDLVIGQWYIGKITNITKFGAFVDIGIKENGLLHISKMANKFVEDPFGHFKVGQELEVQVVEVDKGRKRISLSLIKEGGPKEKVQGNQGNRNKQRSFQSNKIPPKPKNAFAALKDFPFKK